MESNPELPLASEFSELPPPPHAPRSTSQDIFFGRMGLRAGWSILLFILLFVLFDAGIRVGALTAAGKLKESAAEQRSYEAAKKAGHVPDISVKDVTITEGIDFTSIALASLIMSLIEHRRMRVYGINRAHVLDFLPGAFWGLVSLSLLVFVLHACHVLVFDARLLSGSAAYIYGARWLLTFLFVGLTEEYLTRGFLQYTLMRGLYGLAEKISPNNIRFAAFWLAALFMSILFGAGHLGNHGETAAGLLMVFVAGILFSYALWRTGSLWWAIGFHMAWDWAQSFLWGVPDSGQVSAGRLFQTHPYGNPLLSGGPDGPEGSLLVLPTLLLVFLVIRFTTRQRSQPPLEPEGSPVAIA